MKAGGRNLNFDRLRKRDLLNLLDCIVELQEHGDPATLPAKLVEIVPKLVPSEITGYNEMDVARGRGICYLSNGGEAPALMEALQRNVEQHPVIQYFNKIQDGQARSISDFCTQSQFQQLELFDELYRGMGIADQIAIALISDAGSLIGLAANRSGWGFSTRERALFTLLRPHVRIAHRNARKIQALQDRADQWRHTLDELPLGLAARDRSGQWVWITEVAERMVRQYFPDWRPKPHSMPEAINRWAAAEHTRLERTLATAKNLTVRGAAGHLSLRFLTLASGSHLIVFQEYSVSKTTASLCAAGLTPREAEVMHWVLEGKTNPQIASSLDLSPRTVQKHLERVFQKWQVESRTLAALRALQVLDA